MDKKPDFSHRLNFDECPNSWEYVRKERDIFTGGFDDYPVVQLLEAAWQGLNSALDYERDFFPRDMDERLAGTPVQAFLECLNWGIYPPPEILQSVAEGFDKYISSGGRITLDEAFFGPAKKGVGNWAAQRHADVLYGLFDTYSHWGNKAGQSLESLAEKFMADKNILGAFPDVEHKDADSFLRSLRRWRRKVTTDR